ncbi:hypothetical protein [Umezawaea sp. Da 62-37]|nr:hypothetical protein [Umezawaea sp. Da 62-37]WNV91513.1 hypothetical protein RM788_25620 [Umezawaea sp. Da 62-37]
MAQPVGPWRIVLLVGVIGALIGGGLHLSRTPGPPPLGDPPAG